MSWWEKLKEIGLGLFGKDDVIESASRVALQTYLNYQLQNPLGPAAIKDSTSVFQPIQQLSKQYVFDVNYYKLYYVEVKSVVEVSTKLNICMIKPRTSKTL